MSQERLLKWAETTGPYERFVWVGKDISIADVKAWVRESLEPEPEIEHCLICGGIFDHTVGCPEMDKPR